MVFGVQLKTCSSVRILFCKIAWISGSKFLCFCCCRHFHTFLNSGRSDYVKKINKLIEISLQFYSCVMQLVQMAWRKGQPQKWAIFSFSLTFLAHTKFLPLSHKDIEDNSLFRRKTKTHLTELAPHVNISRVASLQMKYWHLLLKSELFLILHRNNFFLFIICLK